MPEGAISVTRPGPHGNPFKVGMWFNNATGDWYVWMHGDGPAFGNQQVRDLPHSLELFRDYAGHRSRRHPEWLAELRGKDLACWCKEGEPCHADILLELANSNGNTAVQEQG